MFFYLSLHYSHPLSRDSKFAKVALFSQFQPLLIDIFFIFSLVFIRFTFISLAKVRNKQGKWKKCGDHFFHFIKNEVRRTSHTLLFFVVHVLRMTCINNDDSVIFYGVCKIPDICIGHIQP